VFKTFDTPAPTGETISASVRRLSVASQAIEVRVDATMVQFEVDALLVASNSNALRRFHFYFDVWFTDALAMEAGFQWPEEVVVFTDDGLEVAIPVHWGDDEVVLFAEQVLGADFAIEAAEFVALADYSIQYVLDFAAGETLRFSDMSVAWDGVHAWAETVVALDALSVIGGNTVALQELVSLSEVMIGGPIVTFGDAVRWSELVFYVMDFALQPESVTWVEVLTVSLVANTDARPGAFIPGSALLGSPT
jgi:hypothetical protein